jgi:hypothetical protein
VSTLFARKAASESKAIGRLSKDATVRGECGILGMIMALGVSPRNGSLRPASEGIGDAPATRDAEAGKTVEATFPANLNSLAELLSNWAGMNQLELAR